MSIGGIETTQQPGLDSGQLGLDLRQGDEQVTAGAAVDGLASGAEEVEGRAGRTERIGGAREAGTVAGVAAGVHGVRAAHAGPPPRMGATGSVPQNRIASPRGTRAYAGSPATHIQGFCDKTTS